MIRGISRLLLCFAIVVITTIIIPVSSGTKATLMGTLVRGPIPEISALSMRNTHEIPTASRTM